jgi:hypothetical protein
LSLQPIFKLFYLDLYLLNETREQHYAFDWKQKQADKNLIFTLHLE